MSVDHRDALLWPHKDSFKREEYPIGAHDLLDNISADISCKVESRAECWAGSTPVKDSSPSSTEPASMVSDKSSSRGTVETKTSENACLSTDTEHPISEGSLSPPSSAAQPCIEAANLVSTNSRNVQLGIVTSTLEREVPYPPDALASQVDLKETISRDSHLTRSLSNASPSVVNSHPQRYNSPLNYPMSNRMDTSKADSYPYPIHASVEYDRGLNYPSPDARNFPNRPNTLPDASGVGRKRSPSPLSYLNKSYCQSNFQRFPLYQQNRLPSANFWNSNGRPTGNNCSPYYGQDVRRRFAMQQMYRNEQPTRRHPAVVGRDFYPPIRGDLRHSAYPYPGPYNRFRSPLLGYESAKYVPEYHPVYPSNGVRPPVSGHPPPSAMRPGPGSGRFASPYPWPPAEAPYHLAQPRPFHATLVEGPKKRPSSSTRGYKRKRAPSDGDSRSSAKMLSDASDALALSRLLSVNYAQFVSWPEIETPLDVYPPEPAMKRKKVPCHEVAADPDSPKAWSRSGKKYTCLPFTLRSSGISTTQDLLVYLNDTHQGQLDVKNNLLSNALRAAITRLSDPQIPTAPPSPVPPVDIPDPLNLFTKKNSPEVDTEDSCSEKLLLPPPKRRRISGTALPEFEGSCKPCPTPTPATASPMFKGMRREERFTVEMIKASMVSLKVCQYCKMQVLLPTAVTTDSAESSSEGVFCSEICLKNHRQMILRQHPPATSSCTLAGASAECSTTGATILLQSPSSKLCKITTSKASSSCKTLRRSSKRELLAQTPVFRWKGSRWKLFSTSADEAHPRIAKDPPVESIPPIFQVLNSGPIPTCALCKCDESSVDSSIVGRLLNYSHDKWVHVNCILWSYKVDETLGGCFVAATKALEQAEKQRCKICGLLGAGVPCFGFDCADNFHIYCAFRHGCVFYQNKSVYCPKHKDQAPETNHLLETFEVNRKVYIERDEDALIENAIASQYTTESGNHLVIRVGTLILNFLGQLLPEHLESGRFHNDSWIYPVGYSATRIYWSYRKPSRRCHYLCSITESNGQQKAEEASEGDVTVLDLPLVHPSPVFTVTVREEGFPNASFKGGDCTKVWQHILSLVEESRRRTLPQMRHLFSEKLSGERLFGLNEPCIVRAVESLPGVEHLNGYFFKFGRMQLLSRMPSIINPSGCARCEPMRRNYMRNREVMVTECEPKHQRSSYSTAAAAQWALLKPLNRIPRFASSALTVTSSTGGTSVVCPALISPTARYRAMQTEWRDKVFLARSKIQGLGLFAARDLEKSEFIIEYIGQLIRNEVGNRRERLYESQGRGIYMFRADDDWIVDATMYGGLARYINHSCEPNCTAEVITHESLKRIVIMAKRLIKKGEELTYDYQLDVEPESGNRIPCLCGARLCRQWMN